MIRHLNKFAQFYALAIFTLSVLIISFFIGPCLNNNQLNFVKTIFEITAIIIGIIYFSKWRIDRKQQVKEELLVSYHTLQNQMQAYIKNMFLILGFDVVKNKNLPLTKSNKRNKQEIWEYRQQVVGNVSNVISPLREALSKSLYIAKIYKIVDGRFEDYCIKTLSEISVLFYNYIRWWGNEMCPSGKTLEEHTNKTNESENKIKNLLSEIEKKMESKCL